MRKSQAARRGCPNYPSRNIFRRGRPQRLSWNDYQWTMTQTFQNLIDLEHLIAPAPMGDARPPRSRPPSRSPRDLPRGGCEDRVSTFWGTPLGSSRRRAATGVADSHRRNGRGRLARRSGRRGPHPLPRERGRSRSAPRAPFVTSAPSSAPRRRSRTSLVQRTEGSQLRLAADHQQMRIRLEFR
jgi:hypothetical protein